MRLRYWSLLVAAMLGVSLASGASPAAADAQIGLDKSAPPSVLLGDPVPYTLTANNPAGKDPLYNVSFSDVLPDGFEYVGPTDPGSAGEPTVTTTPGGQTLLVWNNVTDLQPASSFTLKFEAKLKTPIPTTIVPVDRNTANVAGSTDERKVPKFANTGAPVADSSVVSSSDTTDTKRAPFVVEKKNTNSPEGELLRGVHDQRSTYTLTIRNNKRVATNNITLTDYLPAQLEFLGCGNEDNSQVVTQEYPGSGPLGAPPVNPTPCPTPVSVETVNSPQNVPGLGNLSGVYTAVTWNVGNFAAGEVKEIKYVAGIPLSENTTTWDGPEPTPGSLEQGSNLDNNNGDSTREDIPEQSITNKVSATGVFTGTAPTPPPGKPDGYVEVTEEHTVTIEDVRMQKSLSPDSPKEFTPGGTAVFTIDIQVSEYMDASNIVVTDTLPDGYCPLGATGTTSWAAEPSCTAQASDPKPSPGFANVPVWDNGSKTYSVIFQPVVSIKANGSATVTLPARMLPNYRNGDALGARTVAGDSFVNTVKLSANTNAIKDSDNNPVEPGQVQVGDDSRAEQGTPLPKISKEIRTRAAPPDFPGGMKCDASLPPSAAPPYVSDPDPLPNFRKGDVICFKLRVDFPSGIDTKNAVVTDFPPVGTEFVVDNQPETGNNAYALTGNNNISVSADLTADTFVLTLGTGGFVPAGGVFEATFAVVVLEPGTGTGPEITGNLMKMRTENTAGVAQSYRDEAEYGLVPPPDLLIDKGVIATDKPAATYPPVNNRLQDNKRIEQGGTATFQINVINQARLPGTDYSVRGVQVWDRLPGQLDCSAVDLSGLQYIKPGTSTILPLPGGIATCDDPPGGSILKYVFPSPDLDSDYAIDVDETLSLIYTMEVPDVAAAGTDYANNSGVRQYEAFTDIPGITATYIPRNNIDPAQDANADAPELTDPSNVFIPGVTVAKDAETSVDETNNNLKTQATIGETITYTYSVKIAKGSTVYRGVLSDTLPSDIGIEFVSLDSAVLVGSPTPLPDLGFGVNSSNGTLTFPTVWDNSTDADQVFRVVVTAKVGQTAASCNAATCDVPLAPGTNLRKRNTAKFESFTEQTGGTKVERTKMYDIFVVQPNPSITKVASPTSVTSTSTEITYTLTAGTPGSRPPLHEVTIIDCVPDTLTIKPGSVSDGGAVGSACDLPNSAGTGVTITWGPFDPLVPGTDKVVTYVANIKPGSPADVKFKNTVGMSGTSMPGIVEGERTYLTGANADVFITGASIDKSVAPSVATIGETVSYTIDTKLPDAAHTNLVVLDTLPPYIDYADVSDVNVECFTTDSTYADPVACSSGVSFTFLGPEPASPGATGQQIGWSFDPLPDQDKHRIIRITYNSRVSNLPQNAAGVTRTNTASAGYNYTSKPTTLAQAQNPPKSIGPDNAALDITEPNLNIEKLVNNTDAISALPDDTFEYTVYVTNRQRAGDVPTSPAYRVTVRDCVPDGIEVVSIGGSGMLGKSDACTTTGKVSITWPTIFSLAVGGDERFTYTAKLKGNTTTAQTNVASVVQWFSLPDSNDDVRQYGPVADNAVVTPSLPDVQIEKKASADLAYIDDPYTWTIEVTNPSTRDPGPTAYAVKVADTLPPNWTYKTDTTVITLDGVQISTTDPAVDSTDPLAVKLAWNTGTDLPVKKKIAITFQGIPGTDVATKPGVGTTVSHINTAKTTWNPGKPADGWDPVTSPNVTAQTVIASADLALTKTHVTDYTPPLQDEDTVIPGTQFKWKVKVTNNGPDKAVGPYVVVDTLPAGNTYVSSQGTGWTCTAALPVVTCTHPNVAPDGLAKDATLPDLFLIVSVDIDAPKAMENTAKVTGKTYDPNPDNNTGKDTVTPLPPNVQIKKFNSDDLAYIDQPYTWRLEITNPSDNVPGPIAYQISANDVLPPNWTYKPGTTVITYDGTEISTDNPTVDANDPLAVRLSWDTKTDLPVNKKIVITFQATPGPAVVDNPKVGTTNPHINTATTSWYPGTPTDDWELQTSDDVTAQTVIASADLELKKSHVTDYTPPLQDEDNVIPGTQFKWKIKVQNNGLDKAVGPYDVVDTLPAGNTYVSYQGTGWTCDQDQVDLQKITCTQPNVTPDGLAKDATLPDLFLIVSVNIDAPKTMENSARVTGKTYDPNLDNNTGKDTVTPLPPNVQIEKFNSDDLAYIDQPYTWRLEITNPSENVPGPIAYQISANDVLPPNWTYKTGSTVITYDGGQISIDDPTVDSANPLAVKLAWETKTDLPVNKKITITFQATPGPDVVDDPGVGTTKAHINTATTSWYPGTPTDDWEQQTSDEVTAQTVIASADLMLEKTHETDYPQEWNVEPDEVVPGTEFDWNIKVTNNGDDASVGPFVVKDTLPAGTEYKDYSGTDWSCDQDLVDLQKITCTHPDVAPNGLAKDDSLPILTLRVKVDAGVTEGPLTNVATVTGKTYDPKPANNTDEDPVTPRPLADLEIVKSRTKPYVVGNQVTYTLAVTNLGPSVSVKDITVVDTLPKGLSIASIDTGPWQCQPTSGETGTLTCVLKQDLQPLEQAPLIKVTVDVLESPGAEAVNTAVVTGTTEDPNPDNNKDTVTDPVVSEVQLGIAKKTTGANPVTAGQSTEFTITVSNLGPAKAKNVTVVDDLQAGLRATSATGPGWSCDVGSGTTVTCFRANFPVSASPSDIVIKADVDKSVPGGTTLKNVATVTTTSPQPDGNPDPATSTVDVVAKSDLAVFKTHNGGPWTIGRTGTWNVRVVNNGPSNNPGPITVVDNLPRGNEFLSASGDGWSCTAAGRTVTCIYGAGLVVGQEAGFSIRVSVVDGAAPSVVNPAEVTSPIPDTDPSNNKATDEVRVNRQKQTADKLPPNPRVLPARKTEQGQKIRTKVRCRTIKASAAGEVSFCKVTRKKNGTVKIKVVGNLKAKVIVTQFAKGTKNYKPFKRVKTYIVRPNR